VQKILQDTFAYTSTLFGMKLGGIEVILMQSGAERKYVVRYGSRTIVDRNIKAVYEIDEFFFRKAPEEVTFGLRNRIPAHVGNLILMLLRNETFHVGIKNTEAIHISFLRMAAHQLH